MTAAVKMPEQDKNLQDKAPSAFKTISEVADELDVPAHVLRFWEQKFPHISPLKRRGGRRYYRPEDVDAIRAVKKLLYDEGYTIKGAVKHFSKNRAARKLEADPVPKSAEVTPIRPQAAVPAPAKPGVSKDALKDVLGNLKEIKTLLKNAA